MTHNFRKVLTTTANIINFWGRGNLEVFWTFQGFVNLSINMTISIKKSNSSIFFTSITIKLTYDQYPFFDKTDQGHDEL